MDHNEDLRKASSLFSQLLLVISRTRGAALLRESLKSLFGRHNSGLYSIACDIEASEHYGLPETGMLLKLHRLRCYCKGFFHNPGRSLA